MMASSSHRRRWGNSTTWPGSMPHQRLPSTRAAAEAAFGVTRQSTPPGRSTWETLARVRTGSARCSSTSIMNTASKEPGAKPASSIVPVELGADRGQQVPAGRAAGCLLGDVGLVDHPGVGRLEVALDHPGLEHAAAPAAMQLRLLPRMVAGRGDLLAGGGGGGAL